MKKLNYVEFDDNGKPKVGELEVSDDTFNSLLKDAQRGCSVGFNKDVCGSEDNK